MSVSAYDFDNGGNTLLFKTSYLHDSSSFDMLQWLDLKTNIIDTIWSGATDIKGNTIGGYTL